MKERTKRGTRLRRMIVVLALGVAIGTMIMATPAAADFRASINHIWSHIKPKADARYLNNSLTIVASSSSIASGSFDSVRVNCPAGFQAIGGGIDPAQVLTMVVTSSGPVFGADRLLATTDGTHAAATGWQVSARNNDASNQTFKAAVICSK